MEDNNKDKFQEISDDWILNLLEHLRPFYPNLRNTTLEEIKALIGLSSEPSSEKLEKPDKK